MSDSKQIGLGNVATLLAVKDKCSQCKFSHVASDPNMPSEILECRRNPPISGMVQVKHPMTGQPGLQLSIGFTMVKQDMNCGEFQPREEH